MPLQQVNVIAPPNVSIADGLQPTMLGGKSGEGIVAELHGKWYSATYRNRVFEVASLTAGTLIPAIVNTVVATFAVWNPLGSGVNMELISYDAVMVQGTTTVVSDVSLWFQTGVGVTTGVPTNLTTLSIKNANLAGSGASQVQAYASASLVTTTALMFKSVNLWGPTNITNSGTLSNRYEFDGKVIVPPGVLVFTAGFAAQSSLASQFMSWAEWPI